MQFRELLGRSAESLAQVLMSRLPTLLVEGDSDCVVYGKAVDSVRRRIHILSMDGRREVEAGMEKILRYRLNQVLGVVDKDFPDYRSPHERLLTTHPHIDMEGLLLSRRIVCDLVMRICDVNRLGLVWDVEAVPGNIEHISMQFYGLLDTLYRQARRLPSNMREVALQRLRALCDIEDRLLSDKLELNGDSICSAAEKLLGTGCRWDRKTAKHFKGKHYLAFLGVVLNRYSLKGRVRRAQINAAFRDPFPTESQEAEPLVKALRTFFWNS